LGPDSSGRISTGPVSFLVRLVLPPFVTAGNLLGRLLAAREKTVGHGDDFSAGKALLGQYPAGPAAHADKADFNPVVGPRLSRQGLAKPERR